MDPHSFSRPDQVVVEHLALNLVADFESHTLRGRASLRIQNKVGASHLRLDTRDLLIEKVTLGEDQQATTHELGDEQPYLGRVLEVAIAADTTLVHVDYATSPQAAAVQWLSREQTAGGRHPFLFTQSQAILARTWVPCQDSPGIRMTYEARIQVPPELMAVMSASNATVRNETGIYEFQMPQPIPSYLLALAIGDLEFRSLGARSGVYAEPSVIGPAAWELADTEAMIEAAERLYGPYAWERYDVIILPPSFPFGGMENPRLTFATPTILAGDRSLVALVAHELAHSWSGNLVTNATWDDFWLNEGFTVYFERRIMEEVYGREYEEMLAVLGFQDLKKTLQELNNGPDTHLRLDLAGRDPDDGMTDVAYEKGALLLRKIEEEVGRERFDRFLRAYFERHAFQSMTSDRLLEILRADLIQGDEALERSLELERWVDGPGVPASRPQLHSQALDQVESQIAAFQNGERVGDFDVEGWTTHHWLHFLRHLPADVDAARLAELDERFSWSDTGNSEILFEWLMRSIPAHYEPAAASLESFLTRQGRRKFLKPLYKQLAATEEGKVRARAIYEKARPTYHAVSVQTIDTILGWQDSGR